MSVQSAHHGEHVVIRVDGHFGFGDYRAFRDVLGISAGGAPRYRVELGRVDSADSAALGILLVLLDHAGGDPARVVLAEPRGQLARMLQCTGLGCKFRVE